MLHASTFQHLDSDEALHETSNQTSELLKKNGLSARTSLCASRSSSSPRARPRVFLPRSLRAGFTRAMKGIRALARSFRPDDEDERVTVAVRIKPWIMHGAEDAVKVLTRTGRNEVTLKRSIGGQPAASTFAFDHVFDTEGPRTTTPLSGTQRLQLVRVRIWADGKRENLHDAGRGRAGGWPHPTAVPRAL